MLSELEKKSREVSNESWEKLMVYIVCSSFEKTVYFSSLEAPSNTALNEPLANAASNEAETPSLWAISSIDCTECCSYVSSAAYDPIVASSARA